MQDIIGFLWTFAFGAWDSLQIKWQVSYWWIMYPSLAAMIFTAAGDFRPRDILLLGAVPHLAAIAWIMFVSAGQDYERINLLTYELDWPLIPVGMFLVASVALIFAILRLATAPGHRALWLAAFGYLMVWALYASNVPFLYGRTAHVARLSIDYGSTPLALGWMTGNHVALLAGFLILPAAGGAIRSSFPEHRRTTVAWSAVILFALWHVVALINYAPMILAVLSGRTD